MFVIDSNEALEFKFVRTAEDVHDDKCIFKPDLSHQVFGESETIFGYKNLKIKIYYSAGRLNTYVAVEYDEKVNPNKADGLKPDPILQALEEVIPSGYTQNLDDFIASLSKEATFKPFGTLLQKFTTNMHGKDREYEVYLVDTTTKDFIAYFKRLQTFVMWYIDAASFLDHDDESWRYFLVFEKYKNDDNQDAYAVVGFATVFEYYAYPENIRPRISQILVFPPFKNQSIGAHLYNAINKHYRVNSKVTDITVETPSEDFQRVRDYVDVSYCSTLESYKPDKIQQGFNQNMIQQANKVYKINPKQARKAYEILRLNSTNQADKAQYQSYRLDVKKRLNVPFQKEVASLKKLQSKMNSSELQAALNLTSSEKRIERLDQDYKKLEEEYRRILDRFHTKPMQPT